MSSSAPATGPARTRTALLLAAASLLLTVLFAPTTPPVRAAAAVERAERADVILYMAEWCGWCRRARALLEEIGADYEEVDVERSAEGRREFEKKSRGRGSIPLLDVDGTIVRGYDEARIRKLVAELEERGGDET
jgi:glutaredoxin